MDEVFLFEAVVEVVFLEVVVGFFHVVLGSVVVLAVISWYQIPSLLQILIIKLRLQNPTSPLYQPLYIQLNTITTLLLLALLKILLQHAIDRRVLLL